FWAPTIQCGSSESYEITGSDLPSLVNISQFQTGIVGSHYADYFIVDLQAGSQVTITVNAGAGQFAPHLLVKPVSDSAWKYQFQADPSDSDTIAIVNLNPSRSEKYAIEVTTVLEEVVG